LQQPWTFQQQRSTYSDERQDGGKDD